MTLLCFLLVILYKTSDCLFVIVKTYLYVILIFPVGIYMFQVNDRNTRTRCKICSKLTIKTPERRHWRRSGVFEQENADWV